MELCDNFFSKKSSIVEHSNDSKILPLSTPDCQ